jgi:hypothetical protein
MRYLTYCALLVAITSCSPREKKDDVSKSTKSIKLGASDKEPLKKFTYKDVARFTIASIMGQDPASIDAKLEVDVYHLKCSRKSDNKMFFYKVTFKGSEVIWGVEDGRWRDSDADEKISFIEKGNRLEIIQTFSDGSESIDKYPL